MQIVDKIEVVMHILYKNVLHIHKCSPRNLFEIAKQIYAIFCQEERIK